MGSKALEAYQREFDRQRAKQQQQSYEHVEGNNDIDNHGMKRVVGILERYKLMNVTLDVPEIDGKVEPGAFIDWLHQVDKELDYKDVKDPNRVELVEGKLVGDTLRWWCQLQRSRIYEYGSQITTWDKMRRILKREFVPPCYERELYMSVLNLKQMPEQSVEDYTEQFFLLTIRSEWSETEEHKVWRYLNGLNKSIQSRLVLEDIFSIPDAIQYAFEAEVELQQKVSATSKEGVIKIYPGFISDECHEEINCSERKKVEYFDEYPQNEYADLGVPTVPSKGVVKIYPGYICDESGEESDCPKEVKYYDDLGEESDYEEYFSDSASLGDDYVHVDEYCNNFGHITPADSVKSMPRESSLVGSSSPKDSTSRSPVLFTLCTSGGKLWDMVIASGACYNFVSYDMVIDLNLEKRPVREPFQIHGPLRIQKFLSMRFAWFLSPLVPSTKKRLCAL